MLLKSEDFLDRVDAVEYLAQQINNDDIASFIIECFNDKNYLVRCEAYDAFHDSKNKLVFLLLLNKLKVERSKIARMYLVSTLCGIVKNIGMTESQKEFIEQIYKKEKALNVILAYDCLLYLNDGDVNRIYKVLGNLNSENYLIRCNVINLLRDTINESNICVISTAYRNRLLIEKTDSVKCLLENEIVEIQENFFCS